LTPQLASGSRFPSLIAGKSRLGFRLRPEVESLSISLEELLNWDNFEPVFTLEAAEAEGIAHEITEPLAHETAIELPLRIVLSPDRSGRWLHRAQPAPSGGKVELWHTRLAGRPGQFSPRNCGRSIRQTSRVLQLLSTRCLVPRTDRKLCRSRRTSNCWMTRIFAT